MSKNILTNTKAACYLLVFILSSPILLSTEFVFRQEEKYKNYIKKNPGYSLLVSFFIKKNEDLIKSEKIHLSRVRLISYFFGARKYTPSNKIIKEWKKLYRSEPFEVPLVPFKKTKVFRLLHFFYKKFPINPHALVCFEDDKKIKQKQSPFHFIASENFQDKCLSSIKEHFRYGKVYPPYSRSYANYKYCKKCLEYINEKIKKTSPYKLDHIKSGLIKLHFDQIIKDKKRYHYTKENSYHRAIQEWSLAQDIQFVNDITRIIVEYADPYTSIMINSIDSYNHTALDYVIKQPGYKFTRKILEDHGAVTYRPLPYNKNLDPSYNYKDISMCKTCMGINNNTIVIIIKDILLVIKIGFSLITLASILLTAIVNFYKEKKDEEKEEKEEKKEEEEKKLEEGELAQMARAPQWH